MVLPTLARGARLISITLQNEDGDNIGEVIEWVMDVEEGRVVYVVAEFYNHPGYYPIPWQLLTANFNNGGYMVNQSRVMKPQLFMNHHDLYELVEDRDFIDKIYQVFELDKFVPRRFTRTPVENGERIGRRLNIESPARDLIRPSGDAVEEPAYVEGKAYGT